MPISNSVGIRLAREWINKQKNVPQSGSWWLGKAGRDKKTGGLKFSLRVANPEKPKKKFFVVMMILIVDESSEPKVIEDHREKYQHIWS